MNSENGLPAEIQRFVDKHLHSEAERDLFLEEYRRQGNERDRQAFLARHAEPPEMDPTGPDLDEAHRQMEAAIQRRQQDKLN